MADDSYTAYLERVLVDQDRILLSEAVNSGKAGALRASYIMVWLSAAESIKRRFRALAVQDDQAGKILGQINQKETQQQAIDMFLLEKGKEYGFLSDSEVTRLAHVYEMRCVYGHPYEEAPNSEALLAAFSDVVQIVLERPVKLRHHFIQSQVQLLANSPSFLDDLQVAVTRYAHETYRKIDNALHSYFITELWKEIEPTIKDTSLAQFHRRAIWFAKAYLSAEPSIALGSWDMVQALTRWPTVASLSLGDAYLWPWLTEQAQDIVVGELIAHGVDRGDCIKTLELLCESGKLSHRQSQRFTEAVERQDPAFQSSAGIHLKYYASGIIKDLKSHNWYKQNPAITVLANAGTAQVASLPEQLQQELGKNVLQSADGSAHEANQLLGEIGTCEAEWPPEFLFGVLLECFVNDDGEVRLKVACLESAIRALKSTEAKMASAILGRVSEAIRNGHHEFSPSQKRLQETIELLDFMGGEFPLAELKVALEGVG